MPHYRITIKLESEDVKEYIIDDPRSAIDFVYLDYQKRVFKKKGAGRVTYFDLVMLSEESLKHGEDRKEVYNEQNNFGLGDFSIPKKQPRRSNFDQKITYAERKKPNSNRQ